ncbi:MAG TPA: hypothetical protein VFU21_03890 [Kofleriaceae bacterium]|nr:hypothetical protein [Kofleriaceae bacterium]
MSARGRDGGEVPEAMAGDDLLSLLYGELPADEAERTGARVAADPALSAQLGEMRRVRDLFAALEDEEPPARLTAQLMAEAARSAPQQRRAAAPAEAGFWARLVSWMQPLVQRPALAAAASLVLVAGVAGVLYMKKGEELTSTAPPPAAEPALEGTATGAVADPSATPPPATAVPEAPADSTGTAEADDEAAPAEPVREERARTDSKPVGKRRKAAKSADVDRNAYDSDATTSKPSVKSGTVYGLSEQEMVPSEQTGAESGAGGGGVVGGAPGDGKADAPAPQAPQPAPSTAPAPEQQKAAPRPSVRELHKRAIDAALDNRCSEVKTLAGQVRAADSGFYAKTFAPDTRLRKCLATPQKAAPAKK